MTAALDILRCRAEQIAAAEYIIRGEQMPGARLWLADWAMEEIILEQEMESA